MRDREKYLQYTEARLGTWPVLIPGNHEEILYQIYGDNWRTPDQANRHGGINLLKGRNPAFLLSAAQMEGLAQVRDPTNEKTASGGRWQ